ncbi:uncharacterized protein LOC123261573 isoform X1 [Cotesia glomerata]|uniref:uncharacterized protein LOC123261573 isoform X1 n=1 Tax=Cotesia glomerata TaxID=32391 RepID=UPI001D032730|nr:uncharacterized protein LOC123261573 isoform X1 [Cotesia glomerata]
MNDSNAASSTAVSKEQSFNTNLNALTQISCSQENVNPQLPNRILPVKNTFQSLCTKCFSTLDSNSINYVPDRQDLKTFLNQSYKGQLILNYYKLHNNLTDTLSNYLAEITFGREINIILKQGKVTLDNPLKKLEVPPAILKNLATEISELFDDKSGIYYSPGFTDGTNRINPTGKLQSQLNYARRQLIDSGLLVITSRRSSVVVDSIIRTIDSTSTISLLNLLKQNSDDLEKIEKAWIDTFSARKQLIADNCLSGEKGVDFITSDFEKKCESAQSFKTSWPNLRATFEDFILSKRIDDVDAATQVVKLAELVDDDEDAVIFSLLPLAIKSSIASTVKRRNLMSWKLRLKLGGRHLLLIKKHFTPLWLLSDLSANLSTFMS